MQLVGWWRRENALPDNKKQQGECKRDADMKKITLFAGPGGLYAIFVLSMWRYFQEHRPPQFSINIPTAW